MAKTTPPCDKTHYSGDTLLAQLAPNAIDLAFLTAARSFFLSFCTGDTDVWIKTLLHADRFFPGHDSAEKMRLTLGVVHEMRQARRSNFRFSNPQCHCCSGVLTQDERYLLQMVQAARQQRLSDLCSSAMLLCEGNETRKVIQAARAFADAFFCRERS
ncbi:MAG: hypothetical protein AAF755_02215 [Pseudomonadota bacterium]